MSKFQLILTTVLGLAIVAGAIAFATIKNSNKDKSAPTITVWGTVPYSIAYPYFSGMSSSNRDTVNAQYVYKSPSTFEQELVEAIADRKGPDGIIMSDSLIYRLNGKLFTIPFTSYPERLFKDSFISPEEIFIDSGNGIIAFPLSIDPLVLYWNRDLFSSEGFAKTPELWSELFPMIPKLTKRDSVGNIVQSAIAMGDLSNVNHGKEILATLILQAGSPIVKNDGNVRSVIAERVGNTVPTEEALKFFTEFVNPSKDSYTWNRSLPNSFSAFVGGQLAMYIGYASEYSKIHEKNPNLDFDIASVPQISKSVTKINHGPSLALAILKSSSKINAAIIAFSTLTSNAGEAEWIKSTGFSPVRRDLLSVQSSNPVVSVANKAALTSRSWLDPNYAETFSIFLKMVDEVSSGRSSVSNAVTEAGQNFNSLIK